MRDPRRRLFREGLYPGMRIDLRNCSLSASTVCEALALNPHPEGGHFRETWRDVPASGLRGSGTCILYLLAKGERSHWHRIDASEFWLWHAGAPLMLGISADGTARQRLRLGPDLAMEEALQGVVPARAWQEAHSLGSWSLVSCVVAPAFEFAGFEMAADNWEPSTV